MSKTQIDKLGDRLRASDRVTDEDLQLLQALRAEHDDALAAVTVGLREIEHEGQSLAPTSRLKTVGTIVEKLKRESTRLTQMQDIAGARIVLEGSRLEQSLVVNAIRNRFPGCKVVDRRVLPSFGYRAVHVLVPYGRCLVEVQVRTGLQDLWAQMFERLGDEVGRQIRYGDPPTDPDRSAYPGGQTRAVMVDTLRKVSDLIEQAEESAELLELAGTTVRLGDLDDDQREQFEYATEQAARYLEAFREGLEPLMRYFDL